MRLLLDTHCWLWAEIKPERFSAATRTLIETASTELLFSAASAWEIAIKYARGKLPLPELPTEYVERRLERTRTTPLAITHLHALRAGALPRHHRDPFDRLLIAQAQIERLRIVTSDPQFRKYDVDLMDAGVLLVEDDSATRELYRVNLKGRGYSVIAVDNGLSALQSVDRDPPDLADRAGIPVLQKPVDPDELARVVDLALARSPYSTGGATDRRDLLPRSPGQEPPTMRPSSWARVHVQERAMETLNVPPAVREKLGDAGVEGLLVMFAEAHRIAVDSFERRLDQNTALLTEGFERRFAELRADVLKWCFVFWVGQLAAMAGLFSLMLPGR